MEDKDKYLRNILLFRDLTSKEINRYGSPKLLNMAACYGRKATVEQLSHFQMEKDGQGDNPLNNAVYSGNLELVKYLVDLCPYETNNNGKDPKGVASYIGFPFKNHTKNYKDIFNFLCDLLYIRLFQLEFSNLQKNFLKRRF